MPKIEIHRRNCVNGFWGIPDSVEGAFLWMYPDEMLQHYISLAEKRQVGLDELREFSFNFEPLDPRDQGGHGVEGVLTIIYEFKG